MSAGERGHGDTRPGGPVGVVTQLWRYPVKSMLGERCAEVLLEGRGILGDRLYAVRDGDGKLGSGKSTRRFRQIDGLFGVCAHYDGAVPVVTLPGGRQVRGDDPQIDEQLRCALRHADVRLVRETSISHFDDAPLHLVTDASLSWLATAVTDAGVDSCRFRPNLVIGTGRPAGFVEDAWVGRTASVGDRAVLEFTHRTERCVMVNNAQSELAQSKQVLRTVGAANDLSFGIYAKVIQTGTAHLGDELRLMA